MKNLTRLLLGLTSSLLLAAGFLRAAERLDPMSTDAPTLPPANVVGAAPPCSLPCAEPERRTPESV